MLAKVGTEKCLPDLRRLQAEGDRRITAQAQNAVKAIEKRLGLPPSTPPSTTPEDRRKNRLNTATEEGGGRRLIVAGAAAWRTEKRVEAGDRDVV